METIGTLQKRMVLVVLVVEGGPLEEGLLGDQRSCPGMGVC